MKFTYIIIAFALTSCSAQKFMSTVNASDYSKYVQPYAQAWSGGAPGSGSGITLYFPTAVLQNNKFVEVYFRGLISTNSSFTADDREVMVTRFSIPAPEKDVIMHIDPSKEAQNEIPEVDQKEFPFELQDDEAVLAVRSYDNTEEEVKYIKITGIQEKQQLFMPSMPRQ